MAKITSPISFVRNFLGKTKDLFGGGAGIFGKKSSSERFGLGLKKSISRDFFHLMVIVSIATGIGFTIWMTFVVIVFIMNASAFVTPQGLLRTALWDGTPVSCTPDYEPLSFSNSAGDPTSSRAWTIVNNLYRGFWCFWNRSPDYPELFDMAAFQANPFPPVGGQNLFWCTYLPIKAFSETGVSICPDCIYTPSMRSWFVNQNRYVDINQALANPSRIKQGDAIIIARDGSPRGRNGDHVAMVWQILPGDAIITVESNNSLKSTAYTISGLSARWGDLSIVGFGSR